MERDRMVEELKSHVRNKNLVKHSFAVEAIMKGLASYFGENQEKWAAAGLMHDIDYEYTADKPEQHSAVGADMLEKKGFDSDIVYAVRVHNDAHGLERKSRMDKALFCADPVSGLITASALILPSKKLSEVTTDFVMNRFNEKGFARGANRENIKKCSELNLELRDFIDISLKAMQGISGELGL